MMSNLACESFDVMTFKSGKMKYAIDVGITKIILVKYKIFRVSHSPDLLNGIINMRGEIIPIIFILL